MFLHDQSNFSCLTYLKIHLMYVLHAFACVYPLSFSCRHVMLVILGITFEHPTNVCCYDITFKAGDIDSVSSIARNDASKIDSHATTSKSETVSKERPSRKNRKKEKEKEKEIVEKGPSKSENKKRLLVLPLEASAVAILLLIVLGGFYVVCHLYSFQILPNINFLNLGHVFQFSC